MLKPLPKPAPIAIDSAGTPDDSGAPTKERERYVRLWPTEILWAITLPPESVVAWLRLTAHYTKRRGDIPDDDIALARFAGVTPRQWRTIRAELIAARLGAGKGGRWIDESQDKSLALQEKASERARTANAARWEKTMRDYLAWAHHDAGRIELRHEDRGRWRSGLFDDLLLLRQAVDELSGRGNLYVSINAPKIISATNKMTSAALRDDDMAFIVRLPIDFDPVRKKGVGSTGEELAEAIRARNHFVSALSSLGWPSPAMGISGNGAHALYRCHLRASEAVAIKLRTLYRGWRPEFSSDVVLFDPTVSNASRIWRLYGTRNRKGEASPDRPHRVSNISIPARWDAVGPEMITNLAQVYAERERQHAPVTTAPRRTAAPPGAGDYSTLDIVGWFSAHGAYKRQIGPGKHSVVCPWLSAHSTADDIRSTSTVIWDAAAGRWPTFHCSHAHCEGRDIRHVMELWNDLDGHCAAEWKWHQP